VELDVEVLAQGLGFPEGPVAMPDGSVIVCEITNSRLSRVSSDGQTTVVAETGGGPNGAAIGPDGALYVCNNGGMSRRSRIQPSLQRVDVTSGEVTTLYTGCEDRQFGALNDIVFDATGHFWFTDFRGDAIYYASPDGSSVTLAIDGVRCPNGIGLSPGGDVVYWAQTYTRQLHRRRISAPGQVVQSPPFDVPSMMRGDMPDPWTLVAGLPGAQEFDSLAVEAGGLVCVGTLLLESGITVVDPSDGSYERHTLPADLADGAVTNICFGGPGMTDAYITCSMTGRLVRCRWPRPGLRLEFQAD
jgi:gluconolactonase